MRKLTAAITGLAVAASLIGSASAATLSRDVPHVDNLALQNQLERDAKDHRLHQAPLGVLIYPRDETSNAADATKSSTAQSAQVQEGENFLVHKTHYTEFRRDYSPSSARSPGETGSLSTSHGPVLARSGQAAT